jgi:hypothetical protein
MNIVKDSVTITMSPEAATELMGHLDRAVSYIEDEMKMLGDIDAGTPESRLMDASTALYEFWKKLKASKYA